MAKKSNSWNEFSHHLQPREGTLKLPSTNNLAESILIPAIRSSRLWRDVAIQMGICFNNNDDTIQYNNDDGDRIQSQLIHSTQPVEQWSLQLLWSFASHLSLPFPCLETWQNVTLWNSNLPKGSICKNCQYVHFLNIFHFFQMVIAKDTQPFFCAKMKSTSGPA